MNPSALTNEFLYEEEKNSVKTIESFTIIIKAIDPLPFLFRQVISLYLTIKLSVLNKKMEKVSKRVKKTIKQMPYEQARDGYALLSKSNKVLSSLISDIDENNYKQLRNGVKLLKELEETYSSVLYLKVDPIPLSEKEKATYAMLEEIWGDDEDEVYARDTHRRLTEML